MESGRKMAVEIIDEEASSVVDVGASQPARKYATPALLDSVLSSSKHLAKDI
jgi:hypothetical protein